MDTAKMKNVIINFLVPIICLGSGLLLFIFVVYPSFRTIPELQGRLDAQTKLRDQLKDKLAKLNRFIDFKSILEENSGLVDRVMPAEQNVPGLLDQIDQIAKESGLEITKLSYSLTDSTGKKDVAAAAYNSVLVSLGADGTYSQMISFMKATEGASRLVNVSNFRFNSTAKDETKLSFTYILSAPYMNVQSSAVTDEPLGLDIAGGDFVSFINKIKGLRYFERSGDLSDLTVEVTQEEISETQETTESTESGVAQ